VQISKEASRFKSKLNIVSAPGGSPPSSGKTGSEFEAIKPRYLSEFTNNK